MAMPLQAIWCRVPYSILTRPESTSTADCEDKPLWVAVYLLPIEREVMRKALVLMMTTCILLAGCLDGITDDLEEIAEELESLQMGCNDSTALNYVESDTTNNTCITEEMLMDAMDVFAESMDSEDTMGGFVMTMSGDMDDMAEDMGMDGQMTIVITTAGDDDSLFQGTEIRMNGMSVYSNEMTSWSVENGTATLIQAGTTEGSFLMNSAMSWEDFLIDWDGMMSDEDEDWDEDDDEPGADWYFTNIDTDSDNLVSWDEVDDFVINAYDGWESDEERDEAMEDFNLSDADANGLLDFDEFEVWFNEGDDCHESCSECDDTEESDCTACPEGTTLVDDDGDGAGECVSDDDMLDDEDDMGMDIDDLDVDEMMDEMYSMFDGIDEDCDGYPDEDCGLPETTSIEVKNNMGVIDGVTVSMPIDGETMDLNFDCDFYSIGSEHWPEPALTDSTDMIGGQMDEDVEVMDDAKDAYDFACPMTGFSMVDADGSELEMEILFPAEVADLLTVDTTLDYEALPFTIEPFDMFICDNGEEIPADWENDGEEDCDDGSDEEPSVHSWESYENGYCEWEGDADGGYDDVWWCKSSEENEDWDSWWYYCENHDVDWHCTDDKGQSEDYEHSANGTEWSEQPENFVCDNGEEIPADWENDGEEDCADGSDEWDDDSVDAPALLWQIWVQSEFGFEGAPDDYSIVISSCTEETDDMGNTELTCGEDLMSVSIVDAMANTENADDDMDLRDYSGIVFLDYDESGTISDGDFIGIGGDTGLDWNQVRLHSTSADAYSDENPLQNVPGFTGIIGVLSLMGAAMIGRRD
ncbi:MAG: hypothetical protein VX473_03060 [Candidatus Thermoplasmatota archaeon]|nr:hypothetical protein [Candidatus Thermoplasmatota archaeon]